MAEVRKTPECSADCPTERRNVCAVIYALWATTVLFQHDTVNGLSQASQLYISKVMRDQAVEVIGHTARDMGCPMADSPDFISDKLTKTVWQYANTQPELKLD